MPIGEVVAQVRALVENGVKEVVLTGVDITGYGGDLPGEPSLGQLCRRLLALVPDLPRLRLSSIDVVEVDADLKRLIAEEPRLMPHLHLSLQAGDDMILKRMKRRHLRDDAIRFCREVRALRPDIVFGADLIAGFPTESDEMFANSLALVEECGLTFLHVFPFSARVGTPAARMPQLAGPVRKERAARLRAAGQQALGRYLAQPGRRGDASAGGAQRSAARRFGHNDHFAPVRLQGERAARRDCRRAGDGRHRARTSDRRMTLEQFGEREARLVPAPEGGADPHLHQDHRQHHRHLHQEEAGPRAARRAGRGADRRRPRPRDGGAPDRRRWPRTASTRRSPSTRCARSSRPRSPRILKPVAQPLTLSARKPHVVLVVGVNGSGKTTTIGKLAQSYKRAGKTVMLAAGDTFRAAAVEQLKIWGERAGVKVVARETGADAAGLAYDALVAAKDAGRRPAADRHRRPAAEQDRPDGRAAEDRARASASSTPRRRTAPCWCWTPPPARTPIPRSRSSRRMCDVTGLIVTKLDGSAKGGVLVALAEKFKLPVHAVGVGEGADDLRPFDAEVFARSLMGLPAQ